MKARTMIAACVMTVLAPMRAFAQDEQDAPAPEAAAAPATAAPAPAPAPAFAYASPRAEADVLPAGPPRRPRFRFGLGARVGYIGDEGFDTFASDDTLGQLALEGSFAFYTSHRLSLAAGLAWDVGSRTSGARGLDTRLTVHHVAVPLEARVHLTNAIYVFGKVAPGVAVYHARVEDPSSAGTLEDTPVTFATDLSAGASFLLFPHGGFDRKGVRFWVTPEIGYGLTARTSLRPRADRDEEDVLGSDARSRLGSIAANGVFWRLGVSATF